MQESYEGDDVERDCIRDQEIFNIEYSYIYSYVKKEKKKKKLIYSYNYLKKKKKNYFVY